MKSSVPGLQWERTTHSLRLRHVPSGLIIPLWPAVNRQLIFTPHGVTHTVARVLDAHAVAAAVDSYLGLVVDWTQPLEGQRLDAVKKAIHRLWCKDNNVVMYWRRLKDRYGYPADTGGDDGHGFVLCDMCGAEYITTRDGDPPSIVLAREKADATAAAAAAEKAANTWVDHPGITVPGLRFQATSCWFTVTSDHGGLFSERFVGPVDALIAPLDAAVREFSERVRVTDWTGMTDERFMAQFIINGKEREVAGLDGRPCRIAWLLRQLLHKHLCHVPSKDYLSSIAYWFGPSWSAGIKQYGDNRDDPKKEIQA